MLNFRIGKIVAYIEQAGIDLEKAAKEFFGDYEIYPDMPGFEQISSLFNEWLVFDYKLTGSTTISSDYYLKDPDKLSPDLMNELKQIVETQTYDLFEVEDVNPGKSMDVWGMFSGKKYRVLEKSLSSSMQGRKGSFYNRVARVNGSFYFIGSHPFFFPITYTDRSRTFFSQLKDEPITPKHILPLIIKKESRRRLDLSTSLTKKNIKAKRKKLEKKFKKLSLIYELTIPFQKLTDFVYQESYKDHFGDFYKDIAEVGLPERMIVDNLKFFQDIWNFFPHKKLGGRCPGEKFKEIYG